MRTNFVTVNPIGVTASIGWARQSLSLGPYAPPWRGARSREGRTYTDSSLDFGDKWLCEEFFMEMQKALAPVGEVRL